MPRTMLIGNALGYGVQDYAPILGQVRPATALEPQWTRDVRYPPVTTSQEPQNLLGPTNKGCFTMGALPAGNYVGRVPSVVSLSGGSRQGATLRGAMSGVVLRNAGLGNVLEDIWNWGTSREGGGRILCTAAPLVGQYGGDAGYKDISTSVSNEFCQDRTAAAPASDGALQAAMAAQAQQQAATLQAMQAQNQLTLAAMGARQQAPSAPSSGISTNTLLIAGGIGVGVIALVLLLK